MSEDVFRWVIAGAVFLVTIASVWQAFILVGLYRIGREGLQAGKGATDKIGPLLERFDAILTTTSKILDENRPRVAEITADTLVVAKATRREAERLIELINDASDRAKARIAQIDKAVDHTVAQVEQVNGAVRGAVLKPVKEVNGILAGVKAAVATYAQGGTQHSPEEITQDEEMFI